ncbi:Bug family tripartite tricarboxylate transporter substrate binding protein [Polaromonas sp. AET17H-212]|uniref:Bug family tripartite tricarboxylate transporter substrate binding protein n=1 Tax=Polaromonas sp. AET17H-212 TaxID=1977061 RepID=UPI0020D19426|nr:tripartite tricarboxylate transporter substrate binding protein [Polaromonas sp. AET17H-212]
MKRFIFFTMSLLAVGSALAQATSTGSGQGYPSKPIKFLVPFTAGSGTDLIARSIADTMSKSMGQPIVIENKPGAGGTIAAGQVAKGEADGYTVLVHSSGHALNPAIYSTIGYDTLRDLTGITPLAALPNVLVVNPAKGWKSVADLVAAARAKPGQLNYASAGVGSATHLNAEKFRLQAGIEALHVPYKGTPEAMTNVIGGSNDWFFAPLASALPLVKDGKLQALAVSTPSRSPALPQVPTTVEAGVAGSDYTFWVGMIVASATPAPVVKRLHEEALKAMAHPEVKERMNKLGAEPFPLSVEAFNAFIKTEVDAAARIAKAAGLKGQ